MIPQGFFIYFASMITVLSVLVITRRNPVHSVLLMLLMFFHVAGLYLFLNAEFMAAIQMIVYAGAILVLFLFVVLLLNLKYETATRQFTLQWPTAIIFIAALAGFMFSGLRYIEIGHMGPYSIQKITELTHLKAIGLVLYTDYVYPFEVASLILLVAIIGTLVLAKKEFKSK